MVRPVESTGVTNAITSEGIYAINQSTPGVIPDIIESIVLIQASCILIDKMLLTFLPPLSHSQITQSWLQFLDETQTQENLPHQQPESRLILVSVSKVAERTFSSQELQSPFQGHPWPLIKLDSPAAATTPTLTTTATATATASTTTPKDQKEEQGGALEISGVVTLLYEPESQTGPFRGSVEKLMVSPFHRKKGIATKMMAELETRALAMGRWNLMLDTLSGSPAELVYQKLGYQKLGVVKDYGISPVDGKTLVDEVFFSKDLRQLN